MYHPQLISLCKGFTVTRTITRERENDNDDGKMGSLDWFETKGSRSELAEAEQQPAQIQHQKLNSHARLFFPS